MLKFARIESEIWRARPKLRFKFKNFGVNLTVKRKGKMNEDENLAAPKWLELNADEKILCEFELAHTIHKEVRAALCLLILLLYARDKGFITQRDAVDIGDVYFRYFDSGYSWVSFKVELCFYENKKFLFYCVVDEDSDEYKNLINSLYEISKNDRLLQKHLGYCVKQKLVNP